MDLCKLTLVGILIAMAPLLEHGQLHQLAKGQGVLISSIEEVRSDQPKLDLNSITKNEPELNWN